MTVTEEHLITHLTTYAGLTALISARVYPGRIPQGATLPCLCYERISTPRPAITHDSSGVGNELAAPKFQFDSWATTEKACKAITDQVRAALHGNRSITGLQVPIVQDEHVVYEPETDLWHGISDYTIWNVD